MTTDVTFGLDDVKLQALDQIAASVGHDRSYVINEAISNYLEIKGLLQRIEHSTLAGTYAYPCGNPTA
jgi:predicted transcriptional regulator